MNDEIAQIIADNVATLGRLNAPLADNDLDSISRLQNRFSQADSAYDAVVGTIDGLLDDTVVAPNFNIYTQEQVNIAHQQTLDALNPIIEAQEVGADFWTTNSQQIDFDMGMSSQIDPSASFCVPAGVPFEFFTTLAAQ